MKIDEFFAHLYAPLKSEHSNYEMLVCNKLGGPNARGLINGRYISPFDAEGLKELAIGAMAKHLNLYYSCGVSFKRVDIKYSKEDMAGACFLWAEIDDKDRILSEDEIKSIQNDEYRPSIMVRSGGGWHLYWLLDEFVEDPARIELSNKWLAERFKCDACFDVNRILRVVDTLNFKDLDDPKPVRVLWSEDGLPRRPIDYFPQAAGQVLLGVTGEMKRLQLSDEFLKDSRFLPWIVDAIMDPNPGDRSGRDYKVSQTMGEKGFTEEEIYSVLVHPRWPSGEKGRANDRYARRTAKKAIVNAELLKSAVAVLVKKDNIEVQDDGIDHFKLFEEIRCIFKYVLQPGGKMRKDRDYPKFGAVFGERVASAINKAGYRYVYDAEFEQYYITDRRGRVWQAKIGNEEFRDFISQVSGFGENQEEFKFIAAGIIRQIKDHGEQITIGRWVHYDAERAKFYILADGRTGKMYTINEDGTFEASLNGAADVFLRPRVQVSKPLTLYEGVTFEESIRKLDSLFTQYIAGPETTKKFITSFLLTLTVCYGSDMVGTLPILHLTGPSGGGKSSTVGCMTSYLFGMVQVFLYTTAAAFRSASNEIFMAHDDKEKIGQDMEDFFLLCSTKVTRSMCDTGSQVNIVSQKAHLVNGITSIGQLKTTALRRRTVLIEIDKDKFPSKDALMEDDAKEISKHRDFIWSGMTELFGKIIQHYGDGTYKELCKKAYASIEEGTFRGLSSFIALMVLVEEQISKALNRPFDYNIAMQEFIEAAGLNDKDEILGRDPLVLCLESFFEQLFQQDVVTFEHMGENGANSYHLNTRLKSNQYVLTTDEENATMGELLGCKVRGVKASATGWISIFSKDTNEFAKTINSPTSLGRQFSRVGEKTDFPFYITQGRKGNVKPWSVFQKIE